METISIKGYAVKHKLSIFNVMKMVKSGKLKSKSVEEDGKEVTYIILDSVIEEEVKKAIIPLDDSKENKLQLELSTLREEVKILRKEIEAIKKRL